MPNISEDVFEQQSNSCLVCDQLNAIEDPPFVSGSSKFFTNLHWESHQKIYVVISRTIPLWALTKMVYQTLAIDA